jgi:hypothetical protein
LGDGEPVFFKLKQKQQKEKKKKDRGPLEKAALQEEKGLR